MKPLKNTEKPIKTTILLAAMLLSVLYAMAQDTTQGLIPDVPPSPQAVAFNRLGDYQVNNNYGAPDINIPLFEIDFHGYKIPLTLHYEASPLKPGYNYDVTGVGWTLSGNSCVSRTIKDRADEVGRFNNPFTLDSFIDHSGQPKRYMDYVDELDQLNFQFDSYNIVLPSGRTIPFFMYKSNGVMKYDLLHSDRNVKIECSYGTNSIDSFKVTDENGVKYSFRVADKASNGFENDINAYRNVTWLLTGIDIPTKGTIAFDYTDLRTINTYTISEPIVRISRLFSHRQEDFEENGINAMRTFQSQSPRYKMRFLSRINYGPTRVDFNYYNDGQHMREIVISDHDGTTWKTIRKFTLNISGSALTSLVISGQDDAERLVYGFAYANNTPGNYTDYWGNLCESNTIKELGNFNMFFDKEEIDTTIMKSRLNVNGGPARYIWNKPDDLDCYYKLKLQSTTEGDTRIPTAPNKHGVLLSITYPNGGHTSFNWEKHRFPTATAADGDFVIDRRCQRIIEGGGFRIESIKNYAADGSIASADYYRYGFTLGDIIHRNFPLPLPGNLNLNDTVNHHIGCGEAVVDPNLLTFMSFSYSYNIINIKTPINFLWMTIGEPSSFASIGNDQGTPTWWDAYFSANKFRALLCGRRPVVYPEITVYHGHPFEQNECKSKTVYRYDIYSCQHNPYTYYLSSLQQTALPDTAYFEHLYYNDVYSGLGGSGLRCREFPDKRHQLKSKSDYSFNTTSGTWDLVSEETYSYNDECISKEGDMLESFLSRGHCSNHTLPSTGPLNYFTLRQFYKSVTQWAGRSTMDGKSTTVLRRGGTRSEDNTLSEEYLYLYPSVLNYRKYSDPLKSIDSETYEKEDLFSYIGERNDSSSAVIAAMKSKNMLASLVSAETISFLDSSTILSGIKIDYSSFGNDYLPSVLYERNGDAYEESVRVLSYDSFGNPTEIEDRKTGMHSVFLWDAYGRYMTAMIRNAALSQIQGVLSQLTGDSRSRYSVLKTHLQNSQVQTWDYKPLVGVASHTDENGQTILYEYDGLGRLKSEKRVVEGTAEQENLHEYEYNFINQ